MTKKKDEQKQEDRRSHYDHEEGVLTEPRKEDDPAVIRKEVDPPRDPALYNDEGNGPVPRRGDPYAHQRDEKAAKKAAKKTASKEDKADEGKK